MNPKTDTGPFSVFLIFLKLGLTSFGGPIAHLGYFREECVVKRNWLTEQGYADLVALCQFLPGPASSQVGIGLGLFRAGYKGAVAAWTGFTLPSAVALVLFAAGISRYGDHIPPGFLHGLKVVAVAVVAQAVWGMATSLCKTRFSRTLMTMATCAVLFSQVVWTQVFVIFLAAIAGALFAAPAPKKTPDPIPLAVSRKTGIIFLSLFFLLLLFLPVAANLLPRTQVLLFDSFYRSGALVFGGGHVVLPLLQAEVVPSGLVGKETFLAGYGAAQAVPGPLFTFSAFLGASLKAPFGGWTGGMLCLVAVFLPSFLLTIGALPFWETIRQTAWMQRALTGINAAVVGILLAALFSPVATGAIFGPGDFALALVAFTALMFWKAPPWLVVTLTGLAGWGISLVAG